MKNQNTQQNKENEKLQKELHTTSKGKMDENLYTCCKPDLHCTILLCCNTGKM